MSDFPTISDLQAPKPKSTPQSDQNDSVEPISEPQLISATSAEAQKKFQNKIHEIKQKELEVQAQRQGAKLGYPHIDLDKFPISQLALKTLSEKEAKDLQAVVFFSNNKEIRIGAISPLSERVHEFAKRLEEDRDANVNIYIISKKSFDKVIALYANLPTVEAITKDISISADSLKKVQADVNDFRQLQELLKKQSTTDILTFLLGASLKLDASDMHIEAEENGIVIRFRLDGILHDAAELPKENYKRLVSRIKLVSSLKLNVTDKPQDGRFGINLPEGEVDVRVSTIPTVYGESVVMRLLKQSREGLSLDNLGLRGGSFNLLSEEITRPNGMIITTGPTGSGKTTTLYAVMQMLNKPGVKIITLEDPVEYKMEGVNQSQIDHTKGYTFAKGLRSMLRQDPDIAMVGEIRDLETADIAVQAALTGHLILSTVHTNSAAGAIPRFLSMGVKPFLLAPALNSVIGQRLVRKLCQSCKSPVTLKDQTIERVKKVLEELPEKEKAEVAQKELAFYEPKGCEECGGIGYKGRIGIYEIFIMNPKIEQLVLTGQVSEFEIQKIAVENGMVPMVGDGILKALEGLTSVDEVFRVIE